MANQKLNSGSIDGSKLVCGDKDWKWVTKAGDLGFSGDAADAEVRTCCYPAFLDASSYPPLTGFGAFSKALLGFPTFQPERCSRGIYPRRDTRDFRSWAQASLPERKRDSGYGLAASQDDHDV